MEAFRASVASAIRALVASARWAGRSRRLSLQETLGVLRSSVRRWLKGFGQGKLGKRYEPNEPVNKTPSALGAR